MSSSTALYRAFLRASVKLTNYNFRQYARRRARLGFEENRDLQGARRDEEFQRGCEQLEMLRRCARPRCLPCAPRVHRCLTPKSRGRQAVIGSLYPPSLRSIMEGYGDPRAFFRISRRRRRVTRLGRRRDAPADTQLLVM